jgi:TPP-dependent 2-oxoacid decarboxylase
LGDRGFADRKGLKMVEVVMEREDAPESLKILVRGTAERNSGGGKEELQAKAEVSG